MLFLREDCDIGVHFLDEVCRDHRKMNLYLFEYIEVLLKVVKFILGSLTKLFNFI